MDNNLDIIFNTIGQQDKGLTSKITPSEWNFIVNVLSKQSNHNAEVLKNLKILFQKIIESGSIEQAEIDQLKEEIQIIRNTFTTKADLVDGKIPIEQLPEMVELENEIQNIKDTLPSKADLVDGKVPLEQLPDLTSELTSKADLVEGKVPIEQLPEMDLTDEFAAKADLVEGKVPLEQLPDLTGTLRNCVGEGSLNFQI